MAMPKSQALEDHESKNAGNPSSDARASLEKSNLVSEPVADCTVLPEVSVFNDYVAVLLTPRVSSIALPGNSEWSNVGVIVGVGPKCENNFVLGQNVVINPKGGAIVMVEEQGSAYEGKVVNLYQERNVFYVAKTGPSVKVQ